MVRDMALKTILDKMLISGRDVWPIIEGGKGIGVSSGLTAGAFAAAGAVGTFSGVKARLIDENGRYVPLEFEGRTRSERHEELVKYSVKSAISQARIAFERSKGLGRIHMNVLWEVGGAIRILHGVLSGAKGWIHGITCGAGMPYKLAEIAAQYKVYYYPIISSARVFKILWQRAYHKHAEFLGGVVYEDPWLAGGHNGLSNKDDPDVAEDPYNRAVELRNAMNDVGLSSVPIIMAGGVWCLKEWERFIDSGEVGRVAFQFGTRPILTQESEVSESWKRKLLNLRREDIVLNNFSPTGFYSSAVRNNFLKRLQERSERQISYKDELSNEFSCELSVMRRPIFIKEADKINADRWMSEGYVKIMKTPFSSVIFVTEEEWLSIRNDQTACQGCLSQCRFSNWKEGDPRHTTGLLPDPRSFCIAKTLTDIINSGDVENELLFSGHNAYRFSEDPLYANGNIPTIRQLVDSILAGE